MTRVDAASVNIASWLPRMADEQPDKKAIVCDRGGGAYESWTFGELEAESNRIANGLERIGIRRGTRTILMVRPSLDFFGLVFALFKIGAPPAVIDPGMGRNKMVECLAGVEAEAYIGIPLAHLLRKLHSRAFRTVRHVVTVGRRWFWGGHTLEGLRGGASSRYAMAETKPDEIAAILFTSGSTGPAKGVVYTHAIFDAQVRMLREIYDIRPDEVDLATFPLFALFDPALGMTSVVPEMDFTRPAQADPEKLIRAIRDHDVTNMFGSPALIDRLGRFGESRGVTLPTIKRAISAGAPIAPAVLERFHKLLTSDAQVFTPYGATESLPVTSIGSREIVSETKDRTAAGGGVCVGRPVASMDVRIIRISDEPIDAWSDDLVAPPGEIGEIVVRGPVVTSEYWGNPAATRLAKIASGDGRGLFHRMGDVGYFDQGGRLWMCGRKAHRVVTPDGTLFTVPCEAVFNQHQEVRRTALVGVGRARQKKPVLCVELDPEHARADRSRLISELRALGKEHAHTRGIRTFLFHSGFPVDIRHNAKIFREKLAVWAAESE
ncbi:MAG: AMP-binding protein [Planctomycetes bacterium]|nr:AMP-binding protein [Planctomycetota bacterium]